MEKKTTVNKIYSIVNNGKKQQSLKTLNLHCFCFRPSFKSHT